MSHAEYFTGISRLCRLVAHPLIPARVRKSALARLSTPFVDVELPSDPMVLPARQARALRRELASDLAQRFDAAAVAARDGFTDEQMDELAQSVNPLWVGLAATTWPVLSHLEQRRFEWAREVVAMMAADAVSMHADARDSLEQVREDLLCNSRAAHEAFAMMGLGARHALAALSAVLDDPVQDDPFPDEIV